MPKKACKSSRHATKRRRESQTFWICTPYSKTAHHQPWQQNQDNFNKSKHQITLNHQTVVLWSFRSKVLDWPIVHKVFSFSRVLCLAIPEIQHLKFQDFSTAYGYFFKNRAFSNLENTLFPRKTEPKLLASRRPCSNSSIAARWAPALWPISITCRPKVTFLLIEPEMSKFNSPVLVHLNSQ